MRVISLNKQVLTTLYPTVGIQIAQRASGLREIASYNTFTQLTALSDCPDGGIKKGDKVYVSSKDSRAPYVTNHFKLENGDECILVPLSSVIFMETEG
jgi:hypothetical protein